MTFSEKKRLIVLARCYEIYGEGKARIKMEEAVKNKQFQDNIRKLSKLDI